MSPPRLRQLVAVASLVLVGVAGTGQTHAKDEIAGKKYAVLIGVNTYERGLKNRRFAEADMVALRGAMLARGFEPDHVTLMTPDSGKSNPALMPARDPILKQVGHWAGRCGPEDLLVVAFSGRGLGVDGEDGFLCPIAANPSSPATLLTLDDLRRLLGPSQARLKLMMIDAPGDATPGEDESTRKPRTRPPDPRLVSVFACSAHQASWDDPRSGRGIFFGSVVDALEGRGELAEAGELTLGRFERFVKERVNDHAWKLHAAEQSPTAFKSPLDDLAIVNFRDEAQALRECRSLLEQHRHDEAIERSSRWAAKAGDPSRFRAIRAKARIEQAGIREFARSGAEVLIEDLKRAIEGDASDGESHYWLGAVLAKSGRHGEAIMPLTEAIARRVNVPQALLLRADAHFQMRDFAGAISDADRLLGRQVGKETSLHFAAALLRGASYEALERPEEAESSFTLALQIDRRSAFALAHRARVRLIRSQDLPETARSTLHAAAVADLNLALHHVDPRDPRHDDIRAMALRDRGMIHFHRDEYAEANADWSLFRPLGKIDPFVSDASGQMLMSTRLGTPRPSEALTLFEEAIRADPDGRLPEARLHRASALLLLKRPQKALAQCDEALEAAAKPGVRMTAELRAGFHKVRAEAFDALGQPRDALTARRDAKPSPPPPAATTLNDRR